MTRQETTPKTKWEAEVWSALGKGDGEHCPRADICVRRERGEWCLDKNKQDVLTTFRLSDREGFNIDELSHITADIEKKTPHFFNKGWCKGFIVSRVKKLAEAYIKTGNIRQPPVPMELALLAGTGKAIEIRLVPLKKYSGAVWELKDKWVIQLNSSASPARRRVALFHEVFHIMAHCRAKLAPVFRGPKQDSGSFNEILADMFAFQVLLPDQWMLEYWEEYRDLDKLAAIFRVPRPLVWVKMKCYGLI